MDLIGIGKAIVFPLQVVHNAYQVERLKERVTRLERLHDHEAEPAPYELMGLGNTPTAERVRQKTGLSHYDTETWARQPEWPPVLERRSHE